MAILSGLLGADVVGFQRDADADAFIDCCQTFAAVAADQAKREISVGDGRRVRVKVYPTSVNPDELRSLMSSPTVALARSRLARHFAERTIVRVDRLDPAKNQLIGFKAFDHLLAQRADLRGNVRLLAFLVPSRKHLSRYRSYRNMIRAAVNLINARFSSNYMEPPIELFEVDDREQALAAMESCDVLLANSLADGMNLVAKEWAIVSRHGGVLILSETAGVAEATGDAALLVPPLDVVQTAQAMGRALDMGREERQARLSRIRRTIEAWTAHQWLSAQLEDLAGLSEGNCQSSSRPAAGPRRPGY